MVMPSLCSRDTHIRHRSCRRGVDEAGNRTALAVYCGAAGLDEVAASSFSFGPGYCLNQQKQQPAATRLASFTRRDDPLDAHLSHKGKHKSGWVPWRIKYSSSMLHSTVTGLARCQRDHRERGTLLTRIASSWRQRHVGGGPGTSVDPPLRVSYPSLASPRPSWSLSFNARKDSKSLQDAKIPSSLCSFRHVPTSLRRHGHPASRCPTAVRRAGQLSSSAARQCQEQPEW